MTVLCVRKAPSEGCEAVAVGSCGNEGARIIEFKARKFEFSLREIILKKASL